MTVQGGGGGRKLPPSIPPSNRTEGRDTAFSSAPKEPVAEDPPAVASAREREDAFQAAGERSPAESRLSEATFESPPSRSGITQMLRLFESARFQVGDELRGLREQARVLVDRLAASGFAPEHLAEVRDELVFVRKRMASLHQRLHLLQRRLVSALWLSRSVDGAFAKRFAAQLQRLQQLDPGVARSMLAFTMVEQAFAPPKDGGAHQSPPLVRVRTGLHADAAVGTSLVAAAPGDTVARAALVLLRSGDEPGEPLVSPRAPSPDAATPLLPEGPASFAALADSLRGR